METKSYELRAHRVKRVEIDGKAYDAALGNLTFALDARELAAKMASIAEDGIDQGEILARAEDTSNSARAMAAAMFGDAAAEELLGGAHRLDILRIAGLVSIMADIASSEESMEAVLEAFGA